jgi:hypothetical protein
MSMCYGGADVKILINTNTSAERLMFSFFEILKHVMIWRNEEQE